MFVSQQEPHVSNIVPGYTGRVGVSVPVTVVGELGLGAEVCVVNLLQHLPSVLRYVLLMDIRPGSVVLVMSFATMEGSIGMDVNALRATMVDAAVAVSFSTCSMMYSYHILYIIYRT